MKYFLAILILILLSNCQSKDESFKLFSGIEERYDITDSKYFVRDGSFILDKQNTQQFKVNITKEEDSLVATWVEFIPFEFTDSLTDNVGLSIPKRDTIQGLVAIFSLNDNGNIKGVRNWNQIDSYIDSLTGIYIESIGLNDEKLTSINLIKDDYLNHDIINSTLLVGINVFHKIYDLEFLAGDTIIEIESACFKDDEIKLTYPEIVSISHPDELHIDLLICSGIQEVNANEFLHPNLKTFLPEGVSELYQKVSFVDSCSVRVERSSSLIEYITYWRTMEMDTLKYLKVTDIVRK